MKFKTVIGESELYFEIDEHSGGISVQSDGKMINADIQKISSATFSIIIDGISYMVSVMNRDQEVSVMIDQQKYPIQVLDETRLLLDAYGFAVAEQNHAGDIKAPIPGLITSLFVKENERVKKGQKIFILEAMKMENEIDSPISGRVICIMAGENEAVNKDQVILQIESE